jgi:hypothetical protein
LTRAEVTPLSLPSPVSIALMQAAQRMPGTIRSTLVAPPSAGRAQRSALCPDSGPETSSVIRSAAAAAASPAAQHPPGAGISAPSRIRTAP